MEAKNGKMLKCIHVECIRPKRHHRNVLCGKCALHSAVRLVGDVRCVCVCVWCSLRCMCLPWKRLQTTFAFWETLEEAAETCTRHFLRCRWCFCVEHCVHSFTCNCPSTMPLTVCVRVSLPILSANFRRNYLRLNAAPNECIACECAHEALISIA